MSALHQHYCEQFHDWDRLGRGGLPVAGDPVSLEPPFRPFSGYRAPRPAVVDDGRRPTFASRALEAIQRRQIQQDEEEEPEYEFEFFERDSVVEISVSLPSDYGPKQEASEALLRQINQCSEPVALEIYGTAEAVRFQFAVAEADAEFFVGTLRAFFPDAIFKIEPNAVIESALASIDPADARIIECGLGREFLLPLATGGVDPFIGLVGALSELSEGEFGMFQVLFQPISHPWPENLLGSVVDGEGKAFPWFPPDFGKQATEKASQPLYSVVLRLCAAARVSNQLWGIVTKLAAPLHLFSNPLGNYLIPLASDGEYPLAEHVSDLLNRQSRRFGMLLDAEELLGLVHMPGAEVRSPRFTRQVLHSKAAPTDVLVEGGLYLGENEHHGDTRSVYLSADQRIRHTHIIGSSGTGKSNLLFNLIMDDIETGQGLVVLDPHGDLVDGVLAQIPDDRVDDVVLLDPSDETTSVAFNILTAHTDAERMMLSSDLVSVFERLSSSWGDQMNIILRNAILAFLESDRPGTLSDLRRFLIDRAFRVEFLQSVGDPDIRFYWEKTFEDFSTKQSVGAVVTRLETFLAPKPVRYIVSQEESTLDFTDIMDNGKILLCRLSQGMIGKENAYLFGSLLMSKLQQTAMSRARLEESQRRHFWCYIDEFQNFITPSMAEILTEARKYRLGLILAHQNLTQLQKQHEVASTVLAEANIRIAFRVGDQDAKTLATGFSAFEANDLQSLDRGHAIVRVERSDHDFNISVPLWERPGKDESTQRQDFVTGRSREKYARPREEIEAELRRKMGIEDKPKAVADPKEEAKETTSVSEPPNPASEPKPTSPPDGKDEGKGGPEHRLIQQQIKEQAQEAGYFAEIEKALPGGGSIDIAIEDDNRSIACEVTISTPKDQELANIEKCLAADYDTVLLICPNPRKRKRLRKAIAIQFPEEVERIHCIPLSEFAAILTDQSSASEEAETSSERKRRGFNLSRKFADESSEEARQKEAQAIQRIAKLLRGEG